ncbi:MAG: class I SAM-dependent methyltransferase [Undibacterium sp.]|nr:class I SAM-dependent methyltransferase [Opitutaceae bacterium]
MGYGSGRLASRLAPTRHLKYIGTDVVQEFLDYAQQLTQRPDWDFIRVEDTVIPCADSTADFVCFFSVFTHLTHEDTYRYLREAKRVLKPAGKIVFSFLEFRIPCHWLFFQNSLRDSRQGLHLNQFMDREGINTWAVRLGLKVESLSSGDRPHIPIAEDVVWDNGDVMTRSGHLGQSVAVLTLDREDTPAAAAPPLINTPSAPAASASQPSPPAARFTNVSARGYAGHGNDTFILGFVIYGGKQTVLVRALGPALRGVFKEDTLENPWMEIVDLHGRVIAFNPGLWSASEKEKSTVAHATHLAGAGPITDRDAALVAELAPGAYSLIVRGHDHTCGSVLAEVFAVSAFGPLP